MNVACGTEVRREREREERKGGKKTEESKCADPAVRVRERSFLFLFRYPSLVSPESRGR